MLEKNLILQTKLEPPQVKKGILRRDRLLSLLKENLNRKLILICADAGYGKTTLLAQFCEQLSTPFVYYDLDDTDSNMATFFSYLVAGVRRHNAHFGKAVEDIIAKIGIVDIVVGTFINQFIKEIKEEFYIILDDFHYLQKNRMISNAIDYFLRHLPKNLHFIISSRAVPNINLAYYMAKQELFKIEKEQLRFTDEEIQSLLSTFYDLKVSPEEVNRIAEFSEGWITVLHLILQRIRGTGQETTQATLDNYASSDENIFNYFAREVFEQIPKEIKEFLLKTSVLDYLNPKVCDYLLNIRRSKKIIAYLDAENMFVSKVGANYLYHPIFHEFLRKMLSRYFTSRVVKQLHYKAGIHLLTQNDYTTAVRHFVAAERYAKAAHILEKHHQQWMRRSDYSGFILLVDSFPNAILEEHPFLLLRKADALDGLDKKMEALRITESALRSFRRKRDRKGAAQGLILKAFIYFNQGQRRKGIYHANQAYKLVQKKDSPLKAHIMMQVGSMYRDVSRFEIANEYYEAALKILRRFKDRELEESLMTRIALLYFSISDFKKADKLFMDILSRFSDLQIGLDLVYKYSTIVAINIDVGNYKKASTYLAHAEETLQKYNDPWITKYLVYIRGHLHWAEGRFHKAIEYLSEAVDKYQTYSKILDPYIIGDIVDSHLRLGETHKAREAFSKMDSVIDIINETPNLLASYLTVKGSLEAAEGKFSEALVSLKEALRRLRGIDRYYLPMITYCEMSKCYLRQGAAEQALTYFKKSLDIARLKGYDAYLSIEARDNTDLFKLALENDCMVGYLLHILERVDTAQAKDILNWMGVKRGVYDIECDLLGEMEILDREGQVVALNWRTKKAKSIFAYLIVNQQGCSRDELIDVFWPGRGMREAVHSLQVEISHIRNLLADVLKKGFRPKDVIFYRNKKYFFNPRLVIKTDVREFEYLIKKAEAKEVGGTSDRKRLCLMAKKLYRGDFGKDIIGEWCEERRLYYKGLILKSFVKLGSYYYEQEAWKKSLNYFQQALNLDPYDEAIHIWIMRCHAARGNRDAVQKQYQVLLENLKGLGIAAPSPTATEIYHESLK